MASLENESFAVSVHSEVDVERARRCARALCQSIGLDGASTEAVVLATSELATNLVRYAEHGEMRGVVSHNELEDGVEIQSLDLGPGIHDLARVLSDGHSTGGGLGRGLGVVRRVMDDTVIETGETGTKVVAKKWKKRES